MSMYFNENWIIHEYTKWTAINGRYDELQEYIERGKDRADVEKIAKEMIEETKKELTDIVMEGIDKTYKEIARFEEIKKQREEIKKEIEDIMDSTNSDKTIIDALSYYMDKDRAEEIYYSGLPDVAILDMLIGEAIK